VFISEFPRIERASFTLDITSVLCLYWFSFPFRWKWQFSVTISYILNICASEMSFCYCWIFD
jgi:hypothetical protein